ncbi:MAG: UDP-N-acetylmuramate dehydrogenase [Methylocystaceae bacterium]
MAEEWIRELQNILDPTQVLQEEPMAKHTTFKVGGPAQVLVQPQNRQDIAAVVQICKQANQPWLVIGAGSNLLVREKGIKGAVIELGANFCKLATAGNVITAAAGIRLFDLCRHAARQQLSGLEFAEGIPGSLGGAVFMNAGAYEGEMSQIVTSVISLDHQTGQEKSRTPEELEFSYRHSCFQTNGEIILEATLMLKPANKDDIDAKMLELSQRRREKQPLEFPSAGSTFKRPPGFYVGPLIEEMGLKGHSIGGAQVSTKHSGFVINRGNATAQDIMDLISYIQERVWQEKGIHLEPEVRIVGEE